MRFRSKIVEVDAFRLGTNPPQWAREAVESGQISLFADSNGTITAALVSTTEGQMSAPDTGWWIIRGTEGELYPCMDSVFQRKYVPVE